MASVLGWTGWTKLKDIKNYYQIKAIFPTKTTATEIIDGDTFNIKNGLSVRLLGINAPNRGLPNYNIAKNYLASLILNKELIFEYDKYQEDMYGRILAYVWINDKKVLINEIMVKNGMAKTEVYQARAKLKYQDLLQQAENEAKEKKIGIWSE